MIGGDMKVCDFRSQRQDHSGDFVMFPADPTSPRISLLAAVVVTAMADISSYPFNISSSLDAGVVQGFLICVVMLLLAQFSFHVFARTWVFGEAYTYDQLWSHILGKQLRWVALLLVALSYLSFVIFHGWETHWLLGQLIESAWPNAPSFLLNKWFLLYSMSMLTVVPCLFVKRLADFQGLAWLSLLCVIVGGACVIVRFARSVSEIGFDPEQRIVLFSGSLDKTFTCVSDFFLAFFMHPMIPTIVKDMDHPTMSRCVRVTWWANGISAVANYLIALFSHLLTVDVVNHNSIFDSMPPLLPEVIVGKVASYIVVLCSNGLYVHYMARQVTGFVLLDAEGRTSPNFLSGIVIITLYIGLVLGEDSAVPVSRVIGNVAMVLLTFMLPPMLYLIQFRTSNIKWAICAIVLMVIGLPVGFVMLYVNIKNL